MDVAGQHFHSALPSLFEAIADATFVAIDFEFSGIPPKSPKDGPRGKPSLQQRYEENKLAAEKYHILQMGITCVGENNYRGEYVVRPYNFNLRPGVDKGMNITRDSTYSNDAMDFLEEHGFDREAARKTGIHYLSRAEEARERSLNAQAQDKTRFVDVQPKADDKKAWELLERLRREVNAWVNQVAPKPDFLNFAPIGHNKAPFPDKGLNNFQKLLVHQCIRKEYPDLVTFSQPGFIQIVAYDKEREDARVEYRAGKFEERLVRQVGLRWLIEAIHGGDISKINPDGINRGAGVGKISGVSMFTSIQEQLLGASTVLVGHNLFMDLIYFYACFFGPLPDKVEDFQSIIHKVFPRIIDTKYLATHDDPYLETSELGQLDQKLASEAGPEIVLHPAHSKYASAKPSHEAGYDSYMTARVFLRLSTKLEASGKYLEEPPSPVDDVFYTPPEMGVLIDYNDIPGQLQAIDESSSGSTSRPSSGSAVSRPMFSHATKFDLLGDLSAEVDTITLEGRKQPPGRLPAWESDFWKVYGNKLRVNGTIEEVSDVGEWPQ